jgi:hypothetical protein
MLCKRRFPPPWTIEEHSESFIVRDATGQALGKDQESSRIGIAAHEQSNSKGASPAHVESREALGSAHPVREKLQGVLKVGKDSDGEQLPLFGQAVVQLTSNVLGVRHHYFTNAVGQLKSCELGH